MADTNGAPTIADIIGQWQSSANIASKNGAEAINQAMGKRQDLKNNMAEQKYKAQLGQEEQDRNLSELKSIIGDSAGKGKKISAKIGDVQYSDAETDPALRYASGVKAAGDQFTKIYNQGLPKLQQSAAASSEGLKAINDPTQVGSVGQARTLMLKTMGMNRYNENEAKATLPPNLFQYAHTLFNTVGDDANPIQPNQKQAVSNFFKSSLDTIRQQHDMLYNNAVNAYKMSPYASPTTDLSFNRKPMDTFLDQAIPKPPPAPPSSPTGAPLTPQVQQQPPTAPWWKRILPGSSQPQQAAPAPAQGFDPDAYLKGN